MISHLDLGHILPEKRSIDYRPRMGRRSNENDQKSYEPKPYDVFFTPRMGKRSEVLSNNVPPFGRSLFTGTQKSKFYKTIVNTFSIFPLSILE